MVRVAQHVSTTLHEVVESGFPLLKVRQSILPVVGMRHIYLVASVDSLNRIEDAHRSVSCQPQPHLHITGVWKFDAISTNSLLQRGSNHGGWRRYDVAWSGE